MSSFIGLQLIEDQHQGLIDIVDRQRTRREMLHVSVEARVRGEGSAQMIIDDGSGSREAGRTQSHGEWVELGGQAHT